MEILTFHKRGLTLSFGIDERGQLLILSITDGAGKKLEEENRLFPALELQLTGLNPDDHHGGKHTGGCNPHDLQYQSHREEEDALIFVLESPLLQAELHYDFFEDAKVVRAYSVIRNISQEAVGLEYVSSFCLYGFTPEKIRLPHQGWCRELDWREYTPEELGYSRVTKFSTKRIAVSSTGTWCNKEYLPMGYMDTAEGGFLWQIEHNGSWNFEISDIADRNYLKLSGPSERENGWWKNLLPGECFRTVCAAVAVVRGGFDEAVGEMTAYRRHIAYRSEADRYLPVIFNDYNHCLNADPTTEKELPVIKAAAEAGAEIYCMDAGWYADGTWWETVGAWEVCEKRFPGGMKKVFDAIRDAGMLPGIWLEPESVGIHCPILDRFDDSCFFMRHGKRVIDHGRYQFDFRSPKVIAHLDSVVDRLISEYGIGYFKFDYNIEAGAGTEVDADSFGDGLMKNNAAYLDWVDGIRQRHPEIIIESCASGGMRMDYRTLSHFSLQSLTDANTYPNIANIAAMSAVGVIPEQAAVWCVPELFHDADEITCDMVPSFFRRMHLSGKTAELEEERFSLIREGVAFYKATREEIPRMKPYWASGLCAF